MFADRRYVLSALGLVLVPFGLARAGRSTRTGPPPVLRFRPFEEAVREAFLTPSDSAVRRIEVGYCEALQVGVQGCHNDRPFAGFPAGHLRIVQTGAEPGPARGGVRLYVSTVDVVRTDGRAEPGRPFDFGRIPPAPVLVEPDSQTSAGPFEPKARRV